jgi:hypothetical protein
MATVQTQINLVHLQSGVPVPSVTQRTSIGSQFAANVISVGTTDETIPLGDITTPKQVMVKLISGDAVRVGLDGTTYPFRLTDADEAMLLRLDVEGIVETSTVTTVADAASSLSGKYFDIYEVGDLPVRVWMNMAATPASGSIAYGSPANTDTLVVNGTTFTKVAATPGANEFTDISELNTLVTALSGISSTSDGSIISIVADAAGTAGNSITLAKTGSALTLSGATLTGGSATSSAPSVPGGGRLLPVVIVEDSANGVVATAINEALNADAAFSVSVATNVVTFTDKHTGTRTNIAAGDSGFSVATTQQGAASPVIHLKSTGTSQVVVAVAPH